MKPACSAYPQALAVDADGGVYVTGTFDGTVELGSARINSANGTRILAAKLGGRAPTWTWSSKGTSARHVTAAAVGGDMQPSIAGYVSGGSETATVDFGQALLTVGGRGDGFVAKLHP